MTPIVTTNERLESDRFAANERFYKLVEKVYLYKIENGELDQTNYGNMFSAVEDIMKPLNNNETSPNTNWDQSMQEQHTQVMEDFKAGLIKWEHISLTRIQSLWASIHETSEKVKNKLLEWKNEIKNDLSILEDKVKEAAEKVSGSILGGIFRSIAGGGN